MVCRNGFPYLGTQEGLGDGGSVDHHGGRVYHDGHCHALLGLILALKLHMSHVGGRNDERQRTVKSEYDDTASNKSSRVRQEYQ